MMKHMKLFLLLALCLALTACGQRTSDGSASVSASGVSSSTADVSQSEPDASVPAGSAEEPPAPLTQEDKDHAQDAALDYYLGTVFEVHTLTEIDTKEGEITFQVSCSKDGVKQDPDRTISLERQDGTWNVVNEGY